MLVEITLVVMGDGCVMEALGSAETIEDFVETRGISLTNITSTGTRLSGFSCNCGPYW